MAATTRPLSIWWYALPLLSYAVMQTVAPGEVAGTLTSAQAADPSVKPLWPWWPWLAAALGIALPLAAVWWAARRDWPRPPHAASWFLGLVGAVLWIALCQPEWETRWVERWLGPGYLPHRSGIDPFATFAGPDLWWFLTVRTLLLVALVPCAEELFLRGWLLRQVSPPEREPDSPDLRLLPPITWLWVVVYALLTHPAEGLAALVWFSLVQLWMWRTGNLWDCIVVHAVTNACLGGWILATGQWRLW